LFFLLVSTAIGRDNAKHIVRIISNDGNSGTVSEDVDVPEGEVEAVGECCGVAVGEVDGLGVDDEPEVDDVELGVGVGFCVGVGDGLLLLAEL
jgi:hypothetical protein